jgi:hypothetical protein
MIIWGAKRKLSMRASLFLLAAFVVPALTGCTQLMTQEGPAETRAKLAKCAAENRATPEGQTIAWCLWIGDGTDTAAKLLDPYPLTPHGNRRISKNIFSVG